MAVTQQLQEAQKLDDAQALVDLFEIRLRDKVTYIRFKNNGQALWQTKIFNSWPCQLAGDQRSADEEEARPTLTIANPQSVFSRDIFAGLLENATLTRYRILYDHMIQNLNLAEQRMWYVSRVSQLVRNKSVTLSLRNMSEGPNFMLPVRMYMPPDFPTVSL